VSNTQGTDTKTIQNYIQVDEGVGMARFNNVIYLHAFPNPVTDGFMQIVSDQDLGRVELYSLVGQKLISLEVSDSKTAIDVSGMSRGIYLLKVLNDRGLATRKIHIY
jgi:hypothetical protein